MGDLLFAFPFLFVFSSTLNIKREAEDERFWGTTDYVVLSSSSNVVGCMRNSSATRLVALGDDHPRNSCTGARLLRWLRQEDRLWRRGAPIRFWGTGGLERLRFGPDLVEVGWSVSEVERPK